MPAHSPLTSALRALLLLAAALLGALALAPAGAQAAGSPDLALSVDGGGTVLQGDTTRISLQASSPLGQPQGYNLSYRVVLPVGVTYVGASANPDIAPRVINDQPASSQTTLLWENVADISPNSTNTLSFEIDHLPGNYPIGSTITIDAGAYAHTDPRLVPRFDATGLPIPGSHTGSATGSASTTIAAVEIVKTEPSPEAELLRGLHDQQTTYTLEYRNNGVNSTTGIVIDDYLPAGLEFLGCGGAGADNTTEAPTNPGSDEEYPGSGPITVGAVGGCLQPELVETITGDPDGGGPLPAGTYTHVRWQPAADLAPGDVGSITYAAAIPLRANTTSWTGAEPAPTSLAQTANLDNNSGPETSDETALTNGATIAGLYGGLLPVSDSDTHTVSAEDVRMRKSASSGALAQGAITNWTVTIETSEYRWADAITVTDTVPSGLCPLGAINHAQAPDGQDAECDPVGGQLPSIPYTSVTENANGTYTVVWNPAAIGTFDSNDTLTFTYPTRTRVHYQQNFLNTTPILVADAISNAIALTATAHTICAGGATPQDCTAPGALIDTDFGPTQAVIDASSDGQVAGTPTLTKRVAQASTTCAADTYVSSVPEYRPGDRVCWELRVDYPAALDTAGTTVNDFVAVYDTYDPNLGGVGVGELIGGDDSIGPAPLDFSDATPGPSGTVVWSLPGGLVDPANVFHRYIATSVGLPLTSAGAPSDDGRITSNLFKASVTNTAGVSFPLRDSADYELLMPELALTKRIVAVNGTPIAATQNRQVSGADTVTFAVTITNTGSLDASNLELWDNLPALTPCATVSAISGGGSCAAGRISWGASPAIGPNVAAGGSTTLTYDVTIPDDVLDPGELATNTVGVRKFESPTNQGPVFTYYPDNNIDASVEALANVPELRDTATLTGQAMVLSKTRTSPSDGANNGTAQATIGELITYTVSVTIGPEMSIGNAIISDPNLNATTHPLVGGSTTATLNGGPLPGGFTVEEAVGPPATPRIVFPASYATGAAAETFALTFQARVANVAGNAAGGSLLNRGRIAHDNPNGAGTATQQTSQVSTAIVEPRIVLGKSDNVSPAPVSGGQIVTYTLAVQNGPGGASPVSRAHGTVVTDVVPSGLTPLDAADAPVPDGGSTGGATPATWDAGTRTLTFTTVNAIIEPGATQNLTYKASVNTPPVGGAALTNTADAVTSSMAGVVAGERSGTINAASRYWAQDTNTLNVALASVTKSSSPQDVTIGSEVTYTVDVTIPANVELWDATVIDTLPANIDFDGHVSQTCTAGCPPAPTVQLYDVVTNASTQTVAWDLGDVADHTQARTIRLIYTGHVRATNRGSATSVVADDTSDNTVRVFSNLTDTVGAFNPAVIPGGFDRGSSPATDSVTVREPGVSMVKEVRVNGGAWSSGPVDVEDGDSLEYRIVVTNSSADWPLYDVTVDDQPDAELENVALTTGAAFNTDGWTAGDRDLRWLIPGPIAPGATETLAYTADLIAVTGLSDGQTIDNTASVPSSFGVPAVDRSANPAWTFRSYGPVNDSVQAIFHSPQLTATKTTGAAGFPESAPAEVLQPFTWRVVVENTSTVAGATQLRVVDTLPRDWEYIAGSASFAAGGAIEPVITDQPTGDLLTWSTALTLAPGASRVLTFQARPLAASGNSIGTGPGNPHVNSVTASVRNDAGNLGDAGGPFAAGPDTASATLDVPALTIAKTPDGASLAAGANAAYSIVVSNTGTVDARNLVISDTLPAGTTYTAGSATAVPSTGFSETDGTGPSLAWAITELAAGNSVTISLTLATDPGAASGTVLTNTASAIADELTTPVTDTGDYTLTTSADLDASKSATPIPATAGQPLEYTIGVENLGPSVARAVTLTDTLPATVELTGAPLPGGCTYDSGTRTITCAIGDLNPGATATRVIDVDVLPAATGNASNTVTAATTTPDPVPANDEATVTVPIGTTFDLSIAKTTLDTPILNGQTGRFRLQVANAGPSTATGVTITDTLPAELTYVSDDGGCSYAAPTLTCAVGVVDTDDTPEIIVTVRGNTVGTHTNQASVTGTGTESDPGNNTADADMQVLAAADLRLEKSAAATVAAGGTLAYELTVTNDGPDPATGVAITDTLPAGVTLQAADPGCTAAGQTVTCTIGGLAAGASQTRQLTVQVPIALGTQTLTNTATASGNEGDPTPGNNTDTALTEVGPAADLAVTKSGPANIDQGATILWTVVVANNGPSTATGVQITDQLPAGTTLLATQPSQGTCGSSGDPLECELGTIPAGGTAQVLVAASTADSLGGQSITNRVTVGGNEPDVDLTNNAAEVTTQISTIPFTSARLSITKTADSTEAVWDQPLSYTITVRNEGPSASPNTIVTDTLEATVDYRSATTTQGSCSEASRVVTCNLGTLEVGQVATVRVTVVPNAPGTLRNNATVRGDRSDPNISDNAGVAQLQVSQPSTTLRLRKRLSGARLRAGGNATYKLTVTNTGRTAASDVRVCDQLPKDLTLRSRGKGRIVNGQLCFTLSRLNPGRSKTYSVKVRVSRTTRSAKVTNRATAIADNARRVRARVTSPLQRVAGARTRGLTG